MALGRVVVLDEDTVSSGRLGAIAVLSRAPTYAVAAHPAHGTVSFDAASGAFTYQPAKDYNGPDSFTFVANDGWTLSAPATVSITVNPVNDPPVVPPLSDITNSPETKESFIALPIHDADGDPLVYQVAVSNATIGSAAVDSTGTLIVTPKARGEATVTVHATDGAVTVSGAFHFTVTDVTKLRRFDVPAPREQAITISNVSDHDVAFELTHNGNLLATTGEQLVQEVRDLPDEIQGESFERKLWRYVRDGSYHFDPLTGGNWLHDPLLFLNSVGFGYCDDVAAVFGSLARSAGYPSRAWLLNGHVVPEVQVDGRWAMYDPDLAVYYFHADGQAAEVENLAGNPSLITAPIAPVSTWSWPYSQTVGDIYASTADNMVISSPFFVVAQEAGTIHLAPQARLTYPGRWAATPVTLYGTTTGATSQLRLELPVGFVGVVDWPLVPWDVQGSGKVRVAGVEYAAGSAGLTAALQGIESIPALASLPRSVEVIEVTGPMAIVYLVNPLRFGLRPETTVALRSLEAWALDVRLASQPNDFRLEDSDTGALLRPR